MTHGEKRAKELVTTRELYGIHGFFIDSEFLGYAASAKSCEHRVTVLRTILAREIDAALKNTRRKK